MPERFDTEDKMEVVKNTLIFNKTLLKERKTIFNSKETYGVGNSLIVNITPLPCQDLI